MLVNDIEQQSATNHIFGSAATVRRVDQITMDRAAASL